VVLEEAHVHRPLKKVHSIPHMLLVQGLPVFDKNTPEIANPKIAREADSSQDEAALILVVRGLRSKIQMTTLEGGTSPKMVVFVASWYNGQVAGAQVVSRRCMEIDLAKYRDGHKTSIAEVELLAILYPPLGLLLGVHSTRSAQRVLEDLGYMADRGNSLATLEDLPSTMMSALLEVALSQAMHLVPSSW